MAPMTRPTFAIATHGVCPYDCRVTTAHPRRETRLVVFLGDVVVLVKVGYPPSPHALKVKGGPYSLALSDYPLHYIPQVANSSVMALRNAPSSGLQDVGGRGLFQRQGENRFLRMGELQALQPP
jgi:hypothetical protein